MVKKLLLFSVLIIVSTACSNQKELEGFDISAWQADPNGCQGKRISLLTSLKERKEEMISWNSEDIDRVLGTPDSKDLDKRNRLYYQYDLKGSDKCEGDSSRVYLQIRFNAINRADELIVFE